MVNKVVYEYLKKYSPYYKLEDLKNKILSKGYPEEDFKEAVEILGLEEKQEEYPKQEYPNYPKTQKSFMWIMFSGIIGLFFTLSIIGTSTYYYLISNSLISRPIIFDSLDEIKVPLSIISVLIFLLLTFFIYGFKEIGDNTNSKILSFSSKNFIFLFFISLITAMLYIFLYKEGPLNIFFYVILVLIFINYFLFSIGLIKIREKVGFAGITGILGIFLILISLILTTTRILFSESLSNFINQYFFLIFVFLNLLVTILFFFKSLTLLNASKKFE